jgi:hypothetical protein
MLIFVRLLIKFQQKHSRLLAKEIIKVKQAVCLRECHAPKLMIPFKQKNYQAVFFE